MAFASDLGERLLQDSRGASDRVSAVQSPCEVCVKAGSPFRVAVEKKSKHLTVWKAETVRGTQPELNCQN